jgi:tetratricopeptide (TPR) repeat protein
MKLRAPFSPRQLLFATVIVCGTCFFGALAGAQDVVTKQDNSQVQGKVIGVSGTNLQIQVGQGLIGLPLGQVKAVTMPTPPEFSQAVQAFEKQEYPRAQQILNVLANKYKGIPTSWAQQATAMLGDVHVALGDLTRAEAAYKDFQRFYPGSPLADIGIAAVAVNKKDYATAKEKLEPVTSKALTEKNVPLAMALAYSKAFYLSGQAKEAQGDAQGALEDYLRTVTLFYHDRGSVALAQQKADELRKANPDIFVP